VKEKFFVPNHRALPLPPQRTESRLRGYSTAEWQTEPGGPFVCFPNHQLSGVLTTPTALGTRVAFLGTRFAQMSKKLTGHEDQNGHRYLI
jgi:hypothetical protein